MKNHKVASFYRNDLNPTIVNLQKRIFDYFQIPLEQICFEDTHGEAIDRYLSNTDFESVTLFDIDCIPLSHNVIDIATKLINDDTIYGNAQITMYYTPPFTTYPYVAPSFISFTRNLYETSPEKSFCPMEYPDKSGLRADVAETFVKRNLDRGKRMILCYPVEAKYYKWRFDGNDMYLPFMYGTGTIFANNTYHQFEIRNGDGHFIEYAQNFLKSLEND